MMMSFSDREAAILLGATLMHWGVPFHRVAKRELSADEQSDVDAASHRLIGLREQYRQSPVQGNEEIALADREIDLLIRVVEDCLAECGNDETELDLQMHTRARQEVEALVNRLRQSSPSGAETTA